MRGLFGWIKPQTTKKTKAWEDDAELFPSMARAPKLRKKTPREHKPGLQVGPDIPRYDPKVDK